MWVQEQLQPVSRVHEGVLESGAHRKMLNNATLKLCRAYGGPLEGAVQTVPRAELEAIAQVLENGCAPLQRVSDHKNHCDSIYKGRKHRRRTRGEHVDIWIRFWKRFDQLGGLGEEAVHVKWVRCHQKKGDETSEQRCDR